MRNAKIVMIVMFKNEASVIKRMLHSTIPYIDYYVFQNNGSSDGTDLIVEDFLLKNNLTGEMYDVEWHGFGWNRDHVLQYAQNLNHNCDWIMKMDCDEILEVDEDFDWSPLDNKDTQAFHITAISGDTIYYRAWMWNAKMNWAFNHDPCHETIYNTDPAIGENFIRVNLPQSFRQIGYNEGQSWDNPFKFISDSLILEEKMIKENAFADDLYHFWYIAKSYTDAYPSTAFPLGDPQRREFARRAIFYFDEFINSKHWNNQIGRSDEMGYTAQLMKGSAYSFLGEHSAALNEYKKAEQYIYVRNEHIMAQVATYEILKDYKLMLVNATRMMEKERPCPFPQYSAFIDRSCYHDTGTRVQEVFDKATELARIIQPLRISSGALKRLFVVDNFYEDPGAVREWALSQEYYSDLRWFKGSRSTATYRTDEIKKRFEQIIGEPIIDFEQGYNGVFQIMKAIDQQVYHYDLQKWAGMIYLSPNAPLESGTRLHRSRNNGTRHRDEPNSDGAFNGNFYDSTQFDNCDIAGNIYNRCIIMDAGCFHSAGPYFGDCPENSRLTHLFFFD